MQIEDYLPTFPQYISVMGILIFHHIYFKEDHRRRFIRLVTNKGFIVSTAVAVIWSVAMLNLPARREDAARLREATKDAIVGVTIALLAYLELTIAPFWVIWFVSYYLGIHG
jgi:heme/copper-type cytochrome/quinol oxidase subunit 4